MLTSDKMLMSIQLIFQSAVKFIVYVTWSNIQLVHWPVAIGTAIITDHFNGPVEHLVGYVCVDDKFRTKRHFTEILAITVHYSFHRFFTWCVVCWQSQGH